jgi:HrpA-like RNA helicase
LLAFRFNLHRYAPAAAVAAAVARLRGIGAVADTGDGAGDLELTPLGFHLSHLPVVGGCTR